MGVPQGSILGPLMYLLYINNIRQAQLKGVYTVYVDDTCLIYKETSQYTLESRINEDLSKFKRWVDGNCLTLNVTKTNYMIFKVKNKMDIKPIIKIEDVQLQRVNVTKYLGIQIDENLSWDSHVDKLVKRIKAFTAAIGREPALNWKSAKLVYNAHVLAHVRYLVLIYSQTKRTNLLRIQRILIRALKTLYRLRYSMSKEEVLEITHNLSLEEIIQVEKAKFIHKILKEDVKTNAALRLNREVHSHHTRNRDNIYVGRTRTERAKKRLLISATKTYNELPEWVKKTETIVKFTKNVIEYIKIKKEN